MNKIQTIFERNWEGNRGVMDKIAFELPEGAIATEKVDGTNVRITIRNHKVVRVEKRRNPSKLEKAQGITEPWYVDADEYSPEDKWIYDAVKNTDVSEIEDGDYSGEAYGTNIQGNPLQHTKNEVFLFSVPAILSKHLLSSPPTSFSELKDWLLQQKSTFNSEVNIEGIVWWKDDEPVGKIKVKDFK